MSTMAAYAPPPPTSQPALMNAPSGDPLLVIGRYALYEPIAAGGMATVHFGQLHGEAGFSRTVAIKRLHPHLALMPEFAASFVDEGRLAARIRHPNVIPTLDVVAQNNELFLVMEYVEGATLSQIVRAAREGGYRLPVPVATSIVAGMLHGLHAAHEARGDQGQPLGIVHRDVSPQNVLVGIDGVPRVLDFGVAKALNQVHLTQDGRVKGKLSYMAPEQALGGSVSRQTDIFAAAIVLWEALTSARLFEADSEAQMLHKLRDMPIPRPIELAPDIGPALDDVVMRGLSRDPAQRFPTALEMAVALEAATPLASAHVVGQYVRQLGGAKLAARTQRVTEIESLSKRIVTGTGTFNRSVTAPTPQSSNKAELKKVAVLVLALAVLLPGAWWLTHRRPAAPPTAAIAATPPETKETKETRATTVAATADTPPVAPATATTTTAAASAAASATADTAIAVDALPTAPAVTAAAPTGTPTNAPTASAKPTATSSAKRGGGLYSRE